MSDPFREQKFPRGALLGAAAVVGLALLLVMYVRVAGLDISSLPPPHATTARELRFVDQPNGAVAVYDAQEHEPLQVLPPASNGFLRAIMRSLVRERREHGIGPEQPFRLAASPDGRIMLDDPATGRHVELEAFGHTNANVFAGFLSAQSVRDAQ